jgi:hypothetical protein
MPKSLPRFQTEASGRPARATTGLLRREASFRRKAGSLPRGGASLPPGLPVRQARNFPRQALETRARTSQSTAIPHRNWEILLALIRGVNVLLGDPICASRLRPQCISPRHGDLGGSQGDRRYERKKHDGGAVHASPSWREHSLRRRPAEERRRRSAKRGDRGGTALGIALGFSFQVRHRPIDPSVARPAHMRAP